MASTANTQQINLIVKDNTVSTTSNEVADVFKKQHKDVMRAVERLECSQKFTQRNFAPSKYKDSSGKMNKRYVITRDGFTLLAMGFTGERAMRFKEAYISAFNDMEKKLYIDQTKKIDSQNKKIEHLSEKNQQQLIQIDQLQKNQRDEDTTEMMPEYLREMVYGVNKSLEGNMNMLLMSVSRNTGFTKNTRITNMQSVIENMKMSIRQLSLIIQADLSGDEERLMNLIMSIK